MGSRPPDAVEERRLAGRLRRWRKRTWTKRGLAVLLLAAVPLSIAGALPSPWRWLAILDGSVLTWFGLAAMARAGRDWVRALAGGAALYLVPVLAFLLAGSPWQLALAWPYVPAQAWLACPLGLPCPLGA